ncbi:S8 family serine peptidase [Tenacibaculum amylolyticum]|uniref:S8 family serine peptidase n=1 Tax=Tenacibaculum amylolyticum TaxID=104269 RepID=UPI0038934341
MRVLKPILYSTIAVALASCSSSGNVAKKAVPQGPNVVVDIPAKKAELTDTEKENWQHLDLATDSIPGMSVYKAYEFLNGKKGVEVVVGVVDSGTDLKHEDLKDVAWVNVDEIPGNGIDDDKNGYVDDINGWNFLGDTYKELLEYQRIMQNPSIADAETAAKVKEFYNKELKDAKEGLSKLEQNSFTYGKILEGIIKADEAFTKYFKKSDYTSEEILAIKDQPELENYIAIAKQVFGFGMSSLKEGKSELEGAVNYFTNKVQGNKDLISGEILKKNYRATVGDNPEDIKDSPGYGNGNSGHSTKDESHGTHVSGIIGATRGNGKGMEGVANNVKIMAVRSVPDGDEYDKDVALGIRYAVDNGAKVINTSFGKGYSPHKDWVYDAIKYAADNDVLIVNAAGNSSDDIDVVETYPNDTPDNKNEVADNFITIGAMSANNDKNLPATFTNYGKRNVDVFAPGVQIYATTPDGEYGKKSGTSMAAPATAGVAALIRSYYPQLSASQVKRILMNSGTKIDFEVIRPGSASRENPDGELVPFSDLSVSGRVVNAYNALRMADRIVNGK